MKKLARNISILLIALLLACCLVVGFTACGDDDGNGNNSGGSGDEIVVVPAEGGKSKYTFEAEHTDFFDTTYGTRDWRGYSQNGGYIESSSDASNGYYVTSMYIKEAYIYFEIYSDADAAAELTLTAGMEAMCSLGETEVTLTDSQYIAWYGPDAEYQLKYGSMTFDFTGVGSGMEDRTEFVEYDLGEINLYKGLNVILFQVYNTRAPEGGSALATAPIVDCISLETTASLTWTPVHNVD